MAESLRSAVGASLAIGLGILESLPTCVPFPLPIKTDPHQATYHIVFIELAFFLSHFEK